MLLLQESNFKEIPMVDRENRTTEHCLQEEPDQLSLSAKKLNECLDDIVDESTRFLSGLEFAA
jgi:hypothetical protein